MVDIFTTENILSFLTLSMLEIVLGIDNLVFIALVVERLPESFRNKARYIGISLALVIRIGMLFGAAWIISLTEPLFTVFGLGVSAKDLLLLCGGLFLIVKATLEMHHDVAGEDAGQTLMIPANAFFMAVAQIAAIDFVFSFDSIITAVGITTNLPIIIAAIVLSMLVMLAASGWVSRFLESNPTFKMLALSFVMMIGVLLVAEGAHFHFPRGYIYFAFAFSIFVELLNTVARKKKQPK